MPRIPEYRAGGVATIPGPGSIPVPKATPNTFGASGGRMLEQAGRQVSDFALDYLDKKTKENASIFVSGAMSQARSDFTEDFVKRKASATGDISADFDSFMQTRQQELLAQSPNGLATSRLTIGLNQMRGTFNSKSIIFDDTSRQARAIDTFGLTHTNRLGIAASDFSQLSVLLGENEVEGINLLANVDPLTREKIIRDNRYAIGESAIKGLITGGRATNDQAIKILSDLMTTGESVEGEEYLLPGQAQKLLKEAETQRRTYLAEDRAVVSLRAAQRVEYDRVERGRLYDMAMVALADPKTSTQFAKALANSNLNPAGKEFIKKVYRAELTRGPGEDINPFDKNVKFVELFDATENVGLSSERLKEVEVQLQQSRVDGFLNDAQYKLLTTRLLRPTTQQEKIFLATIKGRLVKANPMTGFADPEGYRLYGEAVAMYEAKKTELTDQNIAISEIFDPKSKHHQVVKDMAALVRNPFDVMKSIAQFRATQEKAEEDQIQADTPPPVAPLPKSTDREIFVRIPDKPTSVGEKDEDEDEDKAIGRRILGINNR